MSSYLSCIVECASDSVSKKITRLISRTTRPIFEEDVDRTDLEFFNVIQSIEFPSQVLVDKNCVVLEWQGKDRFDFAHLRPIFQLDGLDLLLAHEKDSYIGSGDDDEDLDGRYWFLLNQQIDCCNASKLSRPEHEKALDLMKKIDC